MYVFVGVRTYSVYIYTHTFDYIYIHMTCNSSLNGGISIAMLNYRRVPSCKLP